MENYEPLQVEIIVFESEDVIMTSTSEPETWEESI